MVNAGRSDFRLSMAAERLPFPSNVELYDVLNGQEITRIDNHIELDLKPLKGAVVVAREHKQSF
jgi:hypothetical protein